MNSYGGQWFDPTNPRYNPIPSTSGHEISPQQRQTITNQIESDVNKEKQNLREKENQY